MNFDITELLLIIDISEILLSSIMDISGTLVTPVIDISDTFVTAILDIREMFRSPSMGVITLSLGLTSTHVEQRNSSNWIENE